MGSMKKDKIPCPICGETTPRQLMTQIQGDVFVCSKCILKVSIGRRKVRDFTLNDLKEHLIMREKNANLIKNVFRPSKSFEIGWTHISIDDANNLFIIPLNMCGDTNNPPVFKFEELMGYDLLEEECVVEHFSRGIKALLRAPRVFSSMKQYRGELNKEKEMFSYEFIVHLYLSNPYWDEVKFSAGFVTGDQYTIQKNYSKYLGVLHRVMKELVVIMEGDHKASKGTSVPEGDHKFVDISHNEMNYNQMLYESSQYNI